MSCLKKCVDELFCRRVFLFPFDIRQAPDPEPFLKGEARGSVPDSENNLKRNLNSILKTETQTMYQTNKPFSCADGECGIGINFFVLSIESLFTLKVQRQNR